MQVVYDVRMVILENVGHEIPLHELQSRRQDILEAYRVLHQANVVHCDVERRHWRISHGQIKIIDFSESKTLSRCSSIEAGRMCAEEMDMVNDLLGGQG